MASGVSTNNPPGAQLIPDEKVDRIMDRAKSQLEENEVRKLVETLEKMLQPNIRMSLRARRRCFRGLVKICGEHGILPDSYIVSESEIRKLGSSPIPSGGSSEVWAGMYGEDKPVAIKVIRFYVSGDARKVKKNFCREVITWKRLSHPNVLELIGVMMDGKECTMVAPWMDNGYIIEFLRKDLEANPLKLLADAVRGLQYLHSMELAHGNLKGRNILISEDGRVCLADVGLMRIAGDLGGTATVSNATASPDASPQRWRPPEELDPVRFGSQRGEPTKKGDMHSMGMTIYEVLTDKVPFYEYNDYIAVARILDGHRPGKPIPIATRGYTDQLWEMTTSCWKENPSERPTADHVLALLTSAAGQWKSKHGGLEG